MGDCGHDAVKLKSIYQSTNLSIYPSIQQIINLSIYLSSYSLVPGSPLAPPFLFFVEARGEPGNEANLPVGRLKFMICKPAIQHISIHIVSYLAVALFCTATALHACAHLQSRNGARGSA